MGKKKEKEDLEFKAAIDELKAYSVFLSPYYDDIKIVDIGYDEHYSKYYDFASSRKNKNNEYGRSIENLAKHEISSGFCSTNALSVLLDRSYDEVYEKQVALSLKTGVVFNCGLVTTLMLNKKYKYYCLDATLSVADTVHKYQNKYERYLIGNSTHIIAVTNYNHIHDNIIYLLDEAMKGHHLDEEYANLYARYSVLASNAIYVYIPLEDGEEVNGNA